MGSSGQTSNPPASGTSFRVRVTVAEGLKFPSVKAQEILMQISEWGEVQDTKPDLFDPSLDESNYLYEFSLFCPGSHQELQAKLESTFKEDPEIKWFRVEASAEREKDSTRAAQEPRPRQIRIDSRRLEELNRLAGELVILRERFSSVASGLNRFSDNPQLLELSKVLRKSVHSLQEVAGDIQDRTREFQQAPIGSLLQRFQRIARDTSRKLGKKVECVIHGAETEVDGNVLERVSDLLVHLVRNAADHGIESPEEREKRGKPAVGRIVLHAYREEDHLVIEVADDGSGIDPQRVSAKAVKAGFIDSESVSKLSSQEILKFIFRPGFSTTGELSEISGRGVGLDVVKAGVEELSGLLDFRTELGKGTTFVIRLPLSVSIVQALLVKTGSELFALPLASVLRVLKVGSDQLKGVEFPGEIQFPDGKLTTFFLSRFLDVQQETENEEQFLVELGYGLERYGLIVDKVIGRREIVIRPISQLFGHLSGVRGVASLGDGSVVVVLDPRLLVEGRVLQVQGEAP